MFTSYIYDVADYQSSKDLHNIEEGEKNEWVTEELLVKTVKARISEEAFLQVILKEYLLNLK